jgi:vacuolar-type H+-ATPase subunit F/Vma7
MQIRLIGDSHDAIGFGLAGVVGTACHTRPELLQALDDVEHDADVALLVLSSEAAALGPDVIERLRGSVHLPITIVLPPTEPPEAEETTPS